MEHKICNMKQGRQTVAGHGFISPKTGQRVF